jgi:hypothetical protein
LINLIGKTFGKLTVLSRSSKTQRNRSAMWLCLCLCGKTTTVQSLSLRRGNTRSCGCLVSETNRLCNTLAGDEALLRRKFRTYRQSARKKSKQWGLTEAEFRSLMKSPCFYCGTSSPYGIDRVDNADGYTLENSRSCCKVCNYAKNTMSENEFLAWVTQVFHHLSYAAPGDKV